MTGSGSAIPAVVTAGDGRASKAVYGESKVYLEVAERPLVAHVVVTLQQVPEISEVWVVGNPERLEAVFSSPELRDQISKPLYIVPQLRDLWQNCWETYRHVLAGSLAEVRDPESEAELDRQLLYLSGDLPFATPQEISEFVRKGRGLGCDYAVGLATAEALEFFRGEGDEGEDAGIRVAYFNVREGRVRQNNLHLVKPGRIRHRYYIEEMYEHRHQREIGNMISLAGRLLRSRQVGVGVLFLYLMIHLAGVADRRGFTRTADFLRRFVSLRHVEDAMGRLLGMRMQVAVIEPGGAAIDVDTEHEYDVTKRRFEEWRKAMAARSEALYGPLALPAPDTDTHS